MLHVRTEFRADELNHELAPKVDTLSVDHLLNGEETEVLAFLAQRPIHTVAMTSLINDNGLESSLNRGTFYGCRDLNGRLEGVALVGHATLMETISDRALAALAQVAQQCTNTHMIMGEKGASVLFGATTRRLGVSSASPVANGCLN